MAKVDPTVEETPMSDLENFRRETRAWLEANCPPEMRRPMTSDEDTFWGGRNTKFSSEPQRVWFERMRDKGWTVPHWPKEHGGAEIDTQPHHGRDEALLPRVLVQIDNQLAVELHDFGLQIQDALQVRVA